MSITEPKPATEPTTALPAPLPAEIADEQPTSIFADREAKVFTTYDVELQITGQILGGIPSDPHMIRGWLQRNAGVEQADLNRRMLIDTITQLGYDASTLSQFAHMDAVEEAAADIVGLTKTVRFKSDQSGLYVESRGVKAGLREAANIAFPPSAGWFSKTTGKPSQKRDPNAAKGLKSLMAEWVFPKPDRIYLGVDRPDEIITKVSHTPHGASMGLVEAVDQPLLKFQIESFRDLISLDTWAEIFTVFEREGLGANRSMGFGKFVTLKFERAV